LADRAASVILGGMDFDCIVIGGGAAGQSAALALGRARRRTLLADQGRPSNLAAHAVGGLLNHDRRPPAELYERGRAELAAYPAVEHRAATVTDAAADGGRFAIALDDGSRATAAALLLATGMDYRHPDVPGLAERWGGSAFHCPFCHGWEVRERPLAVLDPGETGVHRALLLRAWSDEVTLLTDGAAPVDADRVRAAGVRIEERRVAALRGPGAELEAVVLEDGDELRCQGVLVATTLHQRSNLAARLGATLKAPDPLFADAIEAGPQGTTSVPRLYAAGDAAGVMPSVPNAIASGSTVAAAIVRDLVGAG
jgi:thioredoxin reductase